MIETAEDGAVLSLPFDPEQVSYVRMRQVDIARLFGVTRGRVCQWVKQGKITAYADGRIDPARAAAELVKNCDINRLQAKPFKPMKKELDVVRGQLRDLIGERDHLAAETGELHQLVRELTRRMLEAEALTAALLPATPEGDVAFEAAAERIIGAPLPELARRMDPELRAAILAGVPSLAAELAPPTAAPAVDLDPETLADLLEVGAETLADLIDVGAETLAPM